jgi:hypothetical protein
MAERVNTNVKTMEDVRRALTVLCEGESVGAGTASATIAALPFSDPPTQAECIALRNAVASVKQEIEGLRVVLARKGIV